MKILIISIIVSVIPLFFLFVLVSSLHSKLTKLWNRCREARERFMAATTAAAATDQEKAAARQAWSQVVNDYNRARSGGLARVIGAALGFREAESPPARTSPGE